VTFGGKVHSPASKSRRAGGKLKKESWDSKISVNFTYFGIIVPASRPRQHPAENGSEKSPPIGTAQFSSWLRICVCIRKVLEKCRGQTGPAKISETGGKRSIPSSFRSSPTSISTLGREFPFWMVLVKYSVCIRSAKGVFPGLLIRFSHISKTSIGACSRGLNQRVS
jgi:hypothetical protein